MKKVKLMLLSFVLVATVGGLLAFKAKYHSTFCTARMVGGGCDMACEGQLLNATIVDASGNEYCWTITDNPAECINNQNCKVTAYFVID